MLTQLTSEITGLFCTDQLFVDNVVMSFCFLHIKVVPCIYFSINTCCLESSQFCGMYDTVFVVLNMFVIVTSLVPICYQFDG
uniref:Uncharacterized protein n=1 Tax=Cannabis sativa TaxID=3483 RepID=A0A803R0S0_CANSA